MNINVHFLDKTVSFCTDIAPEERFDAVIVADEPVTRAKLLKFLESCNRLAVVCKQPQEFFNIAAREFKNVQAAGGVVLNPQNEVLMMFRRGRWDLPKGHIEPRESSGVCARREVAEETGIRKSKLVKGLCYTYHAYDLYGQWELKRTQWFIMTCDGKEKFKPQHEEGIEKVQWIPRPMVDELLANSYPTIREVFDNLYTQQ